MQPHLNNSKKLMLNKIIWVTQTQPTCVIRKKKAMPIDQKSSCFWLRCDYLWEAIWKWLGHTGRTFFGSTCSSTLCRFGATGWWEQLGTMTVGFFFGGGGDDWFCFFCGGGDDSPFFRDFCVFFFYVFFFHQGFLWVLWEISGILLPITIAAEDSCCASRGCNL